MRATAVALLLASATLLAVPAPVLAAAAAGKSVTARSQPTRQASGTGMGTGHLHRDGITGANDPDLPPPVLVDAQGTARYVDRETRSFEIGAPGKRVPVRWSRATAFTGAGVASLEGASVHVQGHMAEGVLHATQVDVR